MVDTLGRAPFGTAAKVASFSRSLSSNGLSCSGLGISALVAKVQTNVSSLYPETFELVCLDHYPAFKTGSDEESNTIVDLSNKRLEEIPSLVMGASQVERLYLRNNKLVDLPPELASMTNLRVLDLSLNQLRQLPDVLLRMPYLRCLDLSDSGISMKSSDLERIVGETDMRILFLDGIEWKKRNHVLSKGRALQGLSMRGCDLKKVPRPLNHCQDLRVLNLSRNEIVEAPASRLQLGMLKVLRLSENRLRVFPAVAVKSMIVLEYLDLSNNEIERVEGPIEISAFMRVLKLGRNRLTHFPLEPPARCKLTVLELNDNCLRRLPSGIARLQHHLRNLNLANNMLKRFPRELLSFPLLSSLILVGNPFVKDPALDPVVYKQLRLTDAPRLNPGHLIDLQAVLLSFYTDKLHSALTHYVRSRKIEKRDRRVRNQEEQDKMMLEWQDRAREARAATIIQAWIRGYRVRKAAREKGGHAELVRAASTLLSLSKSMEDQRAKILRSRSSNLRSAPLVDFPTIPDENIFFSSDESLFHITGLCAQKVADVLTAPFLPDNKLLTTMIYMVEDFDEVDLELLVMGFVRTLKTGRVDWSLKKQYEDRRKIFIQKHPEESLAMPPIPLGKDTQMAAFARVRAALFFQAIAESSRVFDEHGDLPNILATGISQLADDDPRIPRPSGKISTLEIAQLCEQIVNVYYQDCGDFPKIFRNCVDKTEEGAPEGDIQPLAEDHTPPPSRLPKELHEVSIVDWKNVGFKYIHPKELARQITIINHRMYAAIHHSECIGQRWHKRQKYTHAPNLLAMIERFNEMANWIALELVMDQDVKMRCQKLLYFIRLLRELHKLRDYQGMMQVIVALNSSPIDRLKKTFGALEAEHKKAWSTWKKLSAVMSMEHNFREYRKLLKEETERCVPFIGVFVSDLTFMDENPKYLTSLNVTDDSSSNAEENMEILNIERRTLFSNTIKSVLKFQDAKYVLESIPFLQRNLLKLPLVSEEDLYELSLIAEPRANSAPVPDNPGLAAHPSPWNGTMNLIGMHSKRMSIFTHGDSLEKYWSGHDADGKGGFFTPTSARTTESRKRGSTVSRIKFGTVREAPKPQRETVVENELFTMHRTTGTERSSAGSSLSARKPSHRTRSKSISRVLPAGQLRSSDPASFSTASHVFESTASRIAAQEAPHRTNGASTGDPVLTLSTCMDTNNLPRGLPPRQKH